ncbi:hypothetical protein EZV73_15490 [Acidaminobacter sp. JC074]|uniref:hypothetical protein n=1 Tax=Acidaminobacter sp. JC074 TaxID=2530199 RepID=UPI001F0E8A75|nr:hypothetical protein [Acidaminobacter sp. JC074]MCH4888997.1 hypothetical protein [Acidaminobacter sp. JC074]
MRAYVKKHDLFLKKSEVSEVVYKYHLQQIAFMQHERLIHLIVLCLTTIVFLLSLTLAYITINIGLMTIALILGILELFYVRHYFFMENHVQAWYKIADDMYEKLYF